MLVLLETPAGYAIFKLLDEKKLKHADNLYADFESPEAANKIVKLKHFEKFSDTTEALAAMTAAVEGKVSKPLKKALNKLVDQDVQRQLLVGDAKLGNAIKDKLNFQCVSNTAVNELMRCMRAQYESLLAGLPKKELLAMTLGLSHSLSRYKLKFSPDKIDTMIVQAVSLLDDLDKELNNYIMRCREWYGWHFPELGKLITDNIAFVKTVKSVGTRENAATTELSDILPEDLEEQVKEAAEISMGTEISDVDILNIQNMCDQIIELTAYRAQLYDYLKVRMMAMAPNLTVLVGELVGARLISHSGSLINLAKHPASTVQILGAEKALFRALKTKKDTPKYGLIYHAQLIGQTSTKNKGKMSRMLAAKASLAVRVDALGDGDDSSFELGAEHKAKLEARLRILEEGNLKRISGTGKAKAKFEKYHGISEIKTYPHAADSTLPSGKRKKSEPGSSIDIKEEVEEDTPKQKRKKLKTQVETEIKTESEESVPKKKSKNKGDVQVEEEAEVAMPKKKKKKRQDVQEQEDVKEEEIKIEEAEVSISKKKKKKRQDVQEDVKEEEIKIEESEQSMSKKKKKKHVQDEVKVEDTEELETKKKKKKKFVEESVASVETPEVVKEKKKKKK